MFSSFMCPQFTCYAAVAFLSVFIVHRIWFGTKKLSPTALVLVFGDLDRSPRMRYHASSLVHKNVEVVFCGYGTTRLPVSEELQAKYTILSIPQFASPCPLPYVVYLAIKIAFLGVQSLYILWRCPLVSLVLVQNPPSFPTMFLGWLCKKIRGQEKCRFVIDMHNTGYSILAMKSKKLAEPARRVEKFGLTLADGVLAVCKEMQTFLSQWDVPSTVIYDRPEASIVPPDPTTHEEAWKQLAKRYRPLRHIPFNRREKPGGSLDLDEPLGERHPMMGEIPFGRSQSYIENEYGFMIVSSTSWTPDEDFTPLLEALPAIDRALEDELKLFLVITGKGELKDEFVEKVNELNLANVRLTTLWLRFEDYPLLLGSADFGLSMHQSSSGVDLPMKIVDMFGVGIPVLARSFKALDELVEEGVVGFHFQDTKELTKLLIKVMSMPPEELDHLKENVKKMRTARGTWDDQWNAKAWPLMM